MAWHMEGVMCPLAKTSAFFFLAMALASGSAFIPSPKARLAAPPTTAARAAVISQLPMPSTEPKFFLFDLDGSHRKEQMRLKVCPRPCAPLI